LIFLQVMAATSRLLVAPSLVRMLATWLEAVLGEMNRYPAISGSVNSQSGAILGTQSAANRREAITLAARRAASGDDASRTQALPLPDHRAQVGTPG
jgi:hypothetical protein